MRAKSFIKTSVNATETKMDQGAWKKMSCSKVYAYTWKNIASKHKPRFAYFMRFFINIVLIGIFLNNFHHNLY